MHPSPKPPYSSGMMVPQRSAWARSAKISQGKSLFFVQLGPDRFDALIGDLAGQILEHLLLFAEQVIHAAYSAAFGITSRPL